MTSIIWEKSRKKVSTFHIEKEKHMPVLNGNKESLFDINGGLVDKSFGYLAALTFRNEV